jgi:phosphate acyltransferase
MRIALDAMGGDFAPVPIVHGAIQAIEAVTDLEVVLVGDSSRLEESLGSISRDRISIHHCSQVIEMDDSPAEAMRRKPDNSISHCWKLLATKSVDAMVGAGSTGAMVAGGLFLKRFLPTIDRPAIATVMPTAKGRCIILDVGANVHPKPIQLLQYGIMGSLYAQAILKIENPTIGLMNVGEEEGKGNDLAQKTHTLFQDSPLKPSFIGNVEGRDIHRGKCDVIVCDGFVGNVILKLCEGVFEFVTGMIAQEVIGPLPNDRQVAGLAMKQLIGKYDYSAFGGAPLLGIDGSCIICHGSSKERAIKNALLIGAEHVRTGVNQKMAEQLQALKLST